MTPRRYALLLSIALTAACGQQNGAGNDEETNEFLVNMSDRLNKHLPDMADENTVLESTAGDNRRFTHFYTLLNYSADRVDTEAFVERMKPALLANACNSELLEPLISRDVTIGYVYADKDRKEFATITVAPAECPNAG